MLNNLCLGDVYDIYCLMRTCSFSLFLFFVTFCVWRVRGFGDDVFVTWVQVAVCDGEVLDNVMGGGEDKEYEGG